VLVVRAEDLNNMPLNDPIGTLALGSDARNIDAVFIAGQVRKWAGAVLDVDLVALREDVRASRERVLHAAGRADRPRRCTDQQREPSRAAHPVAARPPN
jgi:cytosine/adenosine deaminase-related metal-dependent hydrolase